ncbi:MAG: STAS domain-containing protein [Chthoniobacterales bacterium]
MELHESEQSGILILHIKGEIDLHASPDLRTALTTHAEKKCPKLLLDFSEVSYIDSSGLATLIEYCREAGEFDGRLALFGLAPRVRMVFDLVRLNELFKIGDDLPTAIVEMNKE